MVQRHSLAAATLDTLPITVAVLDDDGDILLTNRSWREFGTEQRSDPDDVGVNYVATAADADDEHAARAVAGLEAVLDGDRETFSMEYPCHSPEQKQWFLMRASRFAVDDEPRVSVVHLDITDRKLAELETEATSDRLRDERAALEHVLERIDGLVRDVTDAAVGAGTRPEIERRVCERLIGSDSYVLAWIGRVDVTNQRITPREWASTGDLPLEDGELVLESGRSHPAVRALEDGEPAVVQDVETFADAERWWPTGAGSGFQSVAAFPLEYGDVTYGVLVLFADEPDVFEERELLVLESLAGTIATAMNAIEARRMLTIDTVVELELAIEDPSLFVTALADELDADVSYRGLTYDRDGTPLVFFHVDRDDDVAAAVAEFDAVSAVTELSEHDGGTLLEVAVDADVVTALSEHGAVIRRFDAGDGIADLSVELPTGQSARSAYDLLADRYDRVELISYHESEEPTRTPQDLAARLETKLTDRQLTALRKAYYADYFAWPRNVSGEDLARTMDISRSTFHQHLRTAQRKLLEELFSGE
ncbi:bacterio-opsin activator domain-containing protein [Halosolutus amylolyticus]|uniref:Bacterio-opsin activator domain-containing protein n=1 Tax=Halosolutus amylolyticus TaxID=2932267 RepID=A0ABD5PRT1_9EURY|nr:bacterio-opsin activator domain-containing protein [Halosolutus amylolyticus]